MHAAIKQLTPTSAIRPKIEDMITEEIKILIRDIAYIAEKAVNQQRDLGDEYRGKSAEEIAKIRSGKHTPNYIDDSGNLRQSIGYMIAVDGQQVMADLQSDAARNLAQSALSGNPKGIVLILTAGMEYAYWVHKLGYDVLTTAELFCKQQFKRMLDKYKKK